MLVLTRKRDERIFLPEVGVTIFLVDVKGQRARIGIDAPRHIRVLRGEIMEDDDAALHLQQKCHSPGQNSV